MSGKRSICNLSALALIAVVLWIAGPASASARRQEQSAAPPAAQTQTAPDHSAKSEPAAEGHQNYEEEEEENANLKYSSSVQVLARVTGLSVHAAYYVAKIFNFALILFLVYWLTRKSIPALLAKRTQSIQQALEEARAASAEAKQRLAEIETRLGQLDTEIREMQATAEKDGEVEEARIRKGTEDEMRKVVQDAEQEIAAAAKQARRELTAHTADLAIALARKQIRVDSDTDQSLVRSFATKLSSGDGGKDRN